MNLGQLIGQFYLAGFDPAGDAMARRPLPLRPARSVTAPALSSALVVNGTRRTILLFVRDRNLAGLGKIAAHLKRPTTHTAPELTLLFRAGLLERMPGTRPYVYMITDRGRAALKA